MKASKQDLNFIISVISPLFFAITEKVKTTKQKQSQGKDLLIVVLSVMNNRDLRVLNRVNTIYQNKLAIVEVSNICEGENL